jgi:hypothetical protein
MARYIFDELSSRHREPRRKQAAELFGFQFDKVALSHGNAKQQLVGLIRKSDY